MRYKVIGWTECGDWDYPQHEEITEPVERAIIEEIKAHGYCFGGDVHERYCPVLNDGTYVSYSWRGWGRVMGRAWGTYEGGYDYMSFYMNDFIEEECRVYPELYVDDGGIMFKEQLADTFVMHLADESFAAVKSGKKSVELRLFDEKRKLIDFGDYIEFVRLGHEDERIKMKVKSFDIEQSFEELFSLKRYSEDEDGKVIEIRKYPPETMGFRKGASIKDMVLGMRKYYSEKEEKENGVMAITLEKPEHTCMTYLRLVFDGEYKSTPENFTEAAEALARDFTDDYRIKGKGLEICLNDSYNVDVNKMIRITVRAFIGKEEKLKKLLSEIKGRMYLEIVPYICGGSEKPAQILSLDDDIIEFLYKSGVSEDLDYYII